MPTQCIAVWVNSSFDCNSRQRSGRSLMGGGGRRHYSCSPLHIQSTKTVCDTGTKKRNCLSARLLQPQAEWGYTGREVESWLVQSIGDRERETGGEETASSHTQLCSLGRILGVCAREVRTDSTFSAVGLKRTKQLDPRHEGTSTDLNVDMPPLFLWIQ